MFSIFDFDPERHPKPGYGKLGIWDIIPGFIHLKDYEAFYYPDVILTLIRELEKRDFNVDGINVTFSAVGSGTKLYKYVEAINIPKFDARIYLYPNKDYLKIDIPHRTYKYHRKPERSTSEYYWYTGTNWEKDKEIFRRLWKEPFLSKGDSTADGRNVFSKYIQTIVGYVRKFPETEDRVFTNSRAASLEEFSTLTFEPYPEESPLLYVFQKHPGTHEHYSCGTRNLEILAKKDVVLSQEVCVLGRENQAYSRFSDIHETIKNCPYQHQRDIDVDVVLEIRPHYLHGIYIADRTEADKFKEKCLVEKGYFPAGEKIQQEYQNKIRNTLTLYKDYLAQGLNFPSPIFFIKTDIGMDEVKRVFVVAKKKDLK